MSCRRQIILRFSWRRVCRGTNANLTKMTTFGRLDYCVESSCIGIRWSIRSRRCAAAFHGGLVDVFSNEWRKYLISLVFPWTRSDNERHVTRQCSAIELNERWPCACDESYAAHNFIRWSTVTVTRFKAKLNKWTINSRSRPNVIWMESYAVRTYRICEYIFEAFQ